VHERDDKYIQNVQLAVTHSGQGAALQLGDCVKGYIISHLKETSIRAVIAKPV
jgi:UDP-N-acetylglucosamine transferase subunit ALG13